MTLISNFRRIVYALVATGLLGALPGALSGAAAQAYPARPVKLIVPSPPGGSTDVIARMIAQRLGDALKVNVVVAAACEALQVEPLLVLYCHVAPASTPLTVTLLLLVMPSVLLLPVSLLKASVGAEGAVVSTM